MIRPRLRRLACAALIAISTLSASPAVAHAVPVAPTPTSTAASPEVPDPHPPRGGIGPDGSATGGAKLLSRGLVVPSASPKLPAGLTAKAWVLSDLDTGEILAARDAHGRYQPASILKALTALVLLPKLPGSKVVTASADAANTEGSAVGLVAGGKYSVDTLFRSLLLMSGNDAATALAEAGGGVNRTVAAMNTEAQRLGAYDTFVQTPSGLDGWQQLTSAYDLSLILRAAVANPRFVAYDRTLTAQLPAQKVGARAWGAVPLANQSENFLTGVPGALLAKTGFTDAAQHTYMCAASRGGRRLGVVFLRAQRAPTDQWQQAATLLSWGFALPKRATPVGQLVSPAVAPSTPTPARKTPTPARTSTPSTATTPAPTTTPAPMTTAVAGGVTRLARSAPSHHGVRIWPIVNTVLLLLLAAVIALQSRRAIVRARIRRRRGY